MPHVSAELMERTWRRIGACDDHEIEKLQKQHLRAQNPLTMFVYEKMSVFREDAAGLLLYVYHVVFEAFRTADPNAKLVSKPQIQLASRKLTAAIPFVVDQALESSPEQHVLRYAYEAFTEEGDNVALSEEEIDSFLHIGQIVIACLHGASRRE